MSPDLYTQITTALAGTIEDVFDAKLPDSPWLLTVPVIVAKVISDTPTTSINSDIVLTDERLTLEIQAQNLDDARLVKKALIAALHGWRGTIVSLVEYEFGGPVLDGSDLLPPRYILPVDFMVSY